MPVFRYKAVNAAGDVATGELEAANESEIVDRLRDQGMLPMQVAPHDRRGAPARPRVRRRAARPRRGWFASKTVTRDQLLAITRELATLLRAGLPLDRALEILIGLAAAPPVAALLQQIRDDVRGGKSLSQALDARRDVFSRFYVNIVRAGEAGGALGVVLTRLADTMERNKELRESVKSALIYPTILIGVAVMSVMVLLVWVVPQFEQTFAQAGKALPLPTQIVDLRSAPACAAGGGRSSALVVAGRAGGSAAGSRSRRSRTRWDARAAAPAAHRRPRDQGRGRAVRAHARDAARQRRHAARRARDRQGNARQHRARRTRSTA